MQFTDRDEYLRAAEPRCLRPWQVMEIIRANAEFYRTTWQKASAVGLTLEDAPTVVAQILTRSPEIMKHVISQGTQLTEFQIAEMPFMALVRKSSQVLAATRAGYPAGVLEEMIAERLSSTAL